MQSDDDANGDGVPDLISTEYCDGPAGGSEAVISNGQFFFAVRERSAFIDITRCITGCDPAVTFPEPGFYDRAALFSFSVDFNALDPGVPSQVGLRMAFWTVEGTEWDVIFGHYPNGKFPCSNGAYATVTAYDLEPQDGVLDVWTIEAPADEVCLLEIVPDPKKKGRNTRTPRGRISFPFRITIVR